MYLTLRLAALALLGGMADICAGQADFNAMIGALLFFVFFIGASVDIPVCSSVHKVEK